MIEKITEMTDDFVAEHDSDTALTGTERMRLMVTQKVPDTKFVWCT
jgi:predicted ester cyclase